MAICVHCGGGTEYAPEVLSEICTQCGVLVDGTQTVLEMDAFEAGHSSGSSRPAFRIRSYRDPSRALFGDSDKDERHAANTAASHAFIHSLAGQLGQRTHAERATGFFTRAMTAGEYRWGRKATAVACASLAVALREARKPHSLSQISHVANVSFMSLSRTYTRVVDLLKPQTVIPPSEPLDDIPTLHKHAYDLFTADPCVLPPELRRALRDIMTDDKRKEVLSLATCLTRLRLPPGPHHVTACAIYVLALEGVRRAKLPMYLTLPDHLAHRVSAGVISTRARYLEITAWLHTRVATVPWFKHTAAPRKGKMAVDERDVVARALFDLLKFESAIMATSSNSEAATPVLHIHPDSDAEADDDSSASGAEQEPAHRQKRKREEALLPSGPAGKKAKRGRRSTADAAVHSLLISGATTSAKNAHGHDLHAYLLTCADHQLDSRRPPSRLDLLCAARGGEGAIADDELFGVGELEDVLRSPDEREALLRVMHEEWTHVPKAHQEAEVRRAKGERRTKAPAGWESALDAAFGQAPAGAEAFVTLQDLLDEDGKAAPWDEENIDRNWAVTLDDTHGWLDDY